jgi:Ser/Thr protein kinase RdoA (MazF antagonist)
VVYADIPLTPQLRQDLCAAFGVPAHGRAVRLHGGEESAAYRLGDVVVRIAPQWRTDHEMRWFATLANHAATVVPEVVAPLPAASGDFVVRLGGRPISLWPFVAGEWPTKGDPGLRDQAAELLARLHKALADAPMPDEPPTPMAQGPGEDLADPELDAWLESRASLAVQPLHGDYYRGNVLAVDGRITALLDWDDAYVGPLEKDLCEAAWEWGNGLKTGSLAGPLAFLAAYTSSGGIAVTPFALRQYARARVRAEVLYARTRWQELDSGDHAYHRAQIAAFHALRQP